MFNDLRMFNSEVLVRVSFPHEKIPELQLRVERSDMAFVLKVKIECALRMLQFRDGAMREVTAEDLAIEYRGVPLRDMSALEKYGVRDGAELAASIVGLKPDREMIVKEEDYDYLDDLIEREPGVPSGGMISRLIARRGALVQVCWRQRWFRAEVMNVYSSSLLLKWHDSQIWPEAEWPSFFLRVTLADLANVPPPPMDETWRVRWHKQKPVRELPVVVPRFGDLPPLLWVKAFLRTYAAADEAQILRELHGRLAPELLPGTSDAASRHRVLVLGASGVGKSRLINLFCDGPPPPVDLLASDDSSHSIDAQRAYWPTVGAKRHRTTVQPPGLAPLQLEVLDTSGQARYKALSMPFFSQAQSLVLMFSVKSRDTFLEVSRVGGWLSELTRLTGCSPRNFPMVLVGNKAEDDMQSSRKVYPEDVDEWFSLQGTLMPYIETSLVGDPEYAYHQAERVFRTIARLENQVRQNYGRYQPPDSREVPLEPDAAEVLATDGRQVFGSLLRTLRTPGATLRPARPTNLLTVERCTCSRPFARCTWVLWVACQRDAASAAPRPSHTRLP